MKVVFAGLHYAITAALEYLVRAAKRRDDLEVITIGPYFGTTMPYLNGMQVPLKYDFKPTLILPTTHSAPIEFIENRVGGKVDLWVDVNAGYRLDGKPKHGKRVTFLTDPHVLRREYDEVAHQYDTIYCSQRAYMRPNEVYLPYGYDIEWHAPEDAEKIYDVALVGNVYADRITLFNKLREMGVREYLKVGVGKDDMRRVYAQSKIGINWSSLDDLTARVFELMGCGICPVLNRVTDLPEHFNEGVEYLGFTGLNEAIDQIQYALNNPLEAEKIGYAARNAVVSGKHSWDERLDVILKGV